MNAKEMLKDFGLFIIGALPVFLYAMFFYVIS